MCAILSRCMYNRSILETVAYNSVTTYSGPFTNRIGYSSGGYFHQSCHVIKASTGINVVKLAEFFVEKIEGVRGATAAVVCSP